MFQLNNLSNLIPSLIACELAVDSSSNWRLHVELLEKFSCFPKCLTSDQIYYKFVPLFFRLLSSNVSVLQFIFGYNVTLLCLEIFVWYSDRFQWTLMLTKDCGLIIFLCSFLQRVLPVKLAAARTLCVFIRYNRRYEQRQELCCRLIQGWSAVKRPHDVNLQ